jgi:dTDP-4-dehydrorhamnose reductase
MKGLILVTGSTGLVGSRFTEIYPRRTYLHLPTEVELDITDPSQIKEIFSKHNFGVVVNFAAFTDVGAAEEQRDDRNGSCWKINVEGVNNLVSAINPHKTHFIHISTDYVFPDSEEDRGPYTEDHKSASDSSKATWYGYTKAEGERIVLDSFGDKATVLRLIYPVRAKFEEKPDYLRKPLALFDEGKLYPMFTDQQVSICFIDEACEALEKIIVNNHYGIFHASSRDTTTPHEIVSYLIEKARGVKGAVKPITLDEFLKSTGSSPVRYPRFGGLKVEKTEKKLGIKFSTTRQIVDKLIAQGLGK